MVSRFWSAGCHMIISTLQKCWLTTRCLAIVSSSWCSISRSSILSRLLLYSRWTIRMHGIVILRLKSVQTDSLTLKSLLRRLILSHWRNSRRLSSGVERIWLRTNSNGFSSRLKSILRRTLLCRVWRTSLKAISSSSGILRTSTTC